MTLLEKQASLEKNTTNKSSGEMTVDHGTKNTGTYIDEAFEYDCPMYFDFTAYVEPKSLANINNNSYNIQNRNKLFSISPQTTPSTSIIPNPISTPTAIDVLHINNNSDIVTNLETDIDIQNINTNNVLSIDGFEIDHIELDLDAWFSQYHPLQSPIKKKVNSRVSTSQPPSAPSRLSSIKKPPSRLSSAVNKQSTRLSSAVTKQTPPSRLSSAVTKQVTPARLSSAVTKQAPPSRLSSTISTTTASRLSKAPLPTITTDKKPTTASRLSKAPLPTITTDKKPTTLAKKPPLPSTTTSKKPPARLSSTSTIKQASKSNCPIVIPQFDSETTTITSTTTTTTITTTVKNKSPSNSIISRPLGRPPNIVPILKSTSPNIVPRTTTTIAKKSALGFNKPPLLSKSNIQSTIVSSKKPPIPSNIGCLENKENVDCKNNININNNSNSNSKTCKSITTTTTTTTKVELDLELDLDDTLKAILENHNKKFPQPPPTSTLHSVKEIQIWEEFSGQKYRDCTIEEREIANKWITDKKLNLNSNVVEKRESIF
ncbi:hypothetical protein DLAC_10153 [Tieghemostelium lacteum]|uniref:Uncharacterized protein n=1 Tax=Tieghemostelium lacteum TaxID=361077 RepID=A0A151Z693_TIELA|nr:hypothetical protein DLAC_10153 [Tieghemostelium lacteum]|eukprot:KYQ89479.1 hypothetical protein DLAC_10153 [Tieghemostelium lacteum]